MPRFAAAMTFPAEKVQNDAPDAPEAPSKSQRKREMHELQQLGDIAFKGLARPIAVLNVSGLVSSQ